MKYFLPAIYLSGTGNFFSPHVFVLGSINIKISTVSHYFYKRKFSNYVIRKNSKFYNLKHVCSTFFHESQHNSYTRGSDVISHM